MIEFIESPIFDNWFKQHIPENKLLICSPYVKQDALDRVLKLYNIEESCENVDVQVLIRGGSEEFTINKSSDITVLDCFFALKGFDIDKFKRIENLHMKAYLVDDKYLLITSGNLTRNGLFVFSGQENFEGGIATDDPEIVGKFKTYFEKIWKQGEKFEDFYEKLLAEYEEYISQDYSDRNTVRRIRRKYKFSNYSQNMVRGSETPADGLGYELKDLPPVGNVGYIDDTLDILNNNPDIPWMELGGLLRERLDLIPQNEDSSKQKVNNKKFGEEKSRFLEYFGLATLQRQSVSSNSLTTVNITNLGKLYLEMSPHSKNNYLKDQIFSKPAIIDILRKCPAENLTLLDYLLKYYGLSNEATESTLNRKKGTILRLFKFVINELNPENELLEILNQIN